LIDHAIDLAISFVALAAVFVPLEHAFTARTQPWLRSTLRLDLVYMAAQYLLFLPLLVVLTAHLQSALALVSSGPMRGAPLLLQIPAAVVLGDLLLYAGHRLSHEVDLLWRFHRVHHTSTELDWIAAHREHPVDGWWSQLCLMTPAFLLGVDVLAFGPVFVFRGLCANFVHSNVRMKLGVFGLLFGDPVLHRWHHAKLDRCRHNFANVAPYLDVLFGTHHRPDDERYELGLPEAQPTTFAGQMLSPFR
jgi:sterol desaturase/sphingolipid hydroxylase (fatty acid hydroxylase superfamily)